MDLVFGLSDTEIDDAMTDSNYLKVNGHKSGHDRGIDAVFIDDSGSKIVIHLLNFKYTEKFDKLENNFPSNEIDKVLSFLKAVSEQDKLILKDVNAVLASKIVQIWDIFESESPDIVLHLCSNQYKEMELSENKRLKRGIKEYDVTLQYHLMSDFINFLNVNNHEAVNVKIKAVGKNYFEKSDGNVRALIAEFEARDIVRIVVDDEAVRNDPNIADYKDLIGHKISDSCFKDNVRIYLKQRSKINKSIKQTLLSSDNSKIFYFNNGITMTCGKYEHPGVNRNAPIIEISNMQIVNGCQTVNALFEAFSENPDAFEDVTILCRVYETDDVSLSTKISEYTNSQNPVKSRDIRSIDHVQILLEQQLKISGFYYERKKNQYSDKPKDERIDAELLGQILCAFYHEMPVEAKNKKSSIFGDNYDQIFHDQLVADQVILAWKIFSSIEREKKEKRALLKGLEDGDLAFSSYILYASIYILFVMYHIAKSNSIEFKADNFEEIWSGYPIACSKIETIIKDDLPNKDGKGMTSKNFFKSNRLKFKFLEESDIPTI